MDSETLSQGLGQFLGAEQWYRHWFNRTFLWAEGVAFFADNAGGGPIGLLTLWRQSVCKLSKTKPSWLSRLLRRGQKPRLKCSKIFLVTSCGVKVSPRLIAPRGSGCFICATMGNIGY
jgi:hypothetical protein